MLSTDEKKPPLLDCNPRRFLKLNGVIMTQQFKRSQFDIMHPLYDAIADSDLTAPQAHLLLTLFKFIDGDGVCYPSYNTLQRYTKMSRHTLCKHIKSLSNTGWIDYERGDISRSKSNVYHINLSRIGLTSHSKIVPINSGTSGYIAPDGSQWDCAASYFSSRQSTIDSTQ